MAYLAFQRGACFLSDKEVMNLVSSRRILNYKLESVLDSPERGVAIRREMLVPKLPIDSALACLPYKDYDYSKVLATSVKSVVLCPVVRDASTETTWFIHTLCCLCSL